jgi:hypothetical protein
MKFCVTEVGCKWSRYYAFFSKNAQQMLSLNNLIVFIVLQFSTQLSSNICVVSEHAVSVIHSVLGSMLKNFQVILKFANLFCFAL